jgi:hypothetical protein
LSRLDNKVAPTDCPFIRFIAYLKRGQTWHSQSKGARMHGLARSQQLAGILLGDDIFSIAPPK